MDVHAHDEIELRGLELVAVVGVLAEERTRPQPLVVDICLAVDLSKAGISDELSDTVDYGAVCDVIAQVAATSHPQLLERLAADMCAAVLDLAPGIDAVEVAIRKTRPPVPHALDSSGVRIVRRSSGSGG